MTSDITPALLIGGAILSTCGLRHCGLGHLFHRTLQAPVDPQNPNPNLYHHCCMRVVVSWRQAWAPNLVRETGIVSRICLCTFRRHVLIPESVSEGFSFSRLTAGEKLRHRPACVPVGLHSLIRISASLRCAPRGKNPYATDRFRAAAEPTEKIRGITGPYYGGINGRFGCSCWTATRNREKSFIWREGNQSSRRITRM